MTEPKSNDELNWVDPDVIAYFDGIQAPDYDPILEKGFKEFFEKGWLDSKYDDLRATWDTLIYSDNPHTRVLGKTALWCYIPVFNRYHQAEELLANEDPGNAA